MVKAKQRKTLTSDVVKSLLKELREFAESLKERQEQKKLRLEPTKSYYKEQTSIFHGDVELCLFKQDLDKLTELVETFWLSDEEVTQTVSRKQLKKKLLN